MELEFTKFVSAISRATDFVEEEILHVPRYHEKRVAVLSYHMGRSLGFDEDTLFGLTLAAALHDCALHEALPDDYSQPGYQDREILQSAESFEYDNQGRVIRYKVETNPFRSDIQPAEYLIEYEDHRKKETKFVDGSKWDETVWQYTEKETWRTVRHFSDPETEMWEWIFKMPESFKEVGSEVSVKTNVYDASQSSLYVFEADWNRNLVRLARRSEETGELRTMYSISYDEAGRITELKEHPSDITKYDYDEHGNVIRITELTGSEVLRTIEIKYEELNLPNS